MGALTELHSFSRRPGASGPEGSGQQAGSRFVFVLAKVEDSFDGLGSHRETLAISEGRGGGSSLSASFIADLLWLSHLLRSVSTKKNTNTTKRKHHVPGKIDSEGYGALLESTSCGVLLELRQCFLATWGWQLNFFEGHLVKAPLLSSLRFSMGVATCCNASWAVKRGSQKSAYCCRSLHLDFGNC